MVILADSR